MCPIQAESALDHTRLSPLLPPPRPHECWTLCFVAKTQPWASNAAARARWIAHPAATTRKRFAAALSSMQRHSLGLRLVWSCCLLLFSAPLIALTHRAGTHAHTVRTRAGADIHTLLQCRHARAGDFSLPRKRYMLSITGELDAEPQALDFEPTRHAPCDLWWSISNGPGWT